LERIEGHRPVLANLLDGEVDHLSSARTHADLDQDRLLLDVLLCHELWLILHFWFFSLLALITATLVFGARDSVFL